MVVRNFFMFCVLTNWSPGAGAKYRDFRPFWPRAAPWHLAKFQAKNKKTRFPGASGTFGGEIRPPQKFLTEIAQLFYILCFRRPEPQGLEIAKYWFSRNFWLRAAPWHLEKFQVGNRKTAISRS